MVISIGRRAEPLVSLSVALNDEPAMNALRQLAPVALDGLELAYLEAQRYLLPEDGALCLLRIREGTQAAARLIQTPSGAEAAKILLALRSTEAQAQLRRSGTRRLLRDYSTGMYWGILGSVLVLTVTAVAAWAVLRLFGTIAGNKRQVEQAVLPMSHALVCIGGGAIGSTLSVLVRIRNNLHRLDYHASGTRAALVRIALGWFFAVALLAVIKGAILTLLPEPAIGTPATTAGLTTAWFYWAAIGLLAGLNERWVRDLVNREPAPTPTATETAPDPDDGDTTHESQNGSKPSGLQPAAKG
jgi:hypothetical protein